MWFEKAIDDFNKSIIAEGKSGAELIAAAGNGFTSEHYLDFLAARSQHSPLVVWIAYAFYAVPLIASLAKINVAGGDKYYADDD